MTVAVPSAFATSVNVTLSVPAGIDLDELDSETTDESDDDARIVFVWVLLPTTDATKSCSSPTTMLHGNVLS